MDSCCLLFPPNVQYLRCVLMCVSRFKQLPGSEEEEEEEDGEDGEYKLEK